MFLSLSLSLPFSLLCEKCLTASEAKPLPPPPQIGRYIAETCYRFPSPPPSLPISLSSPIIFPLSTTNKLDYDFFLFKKKPNNWGDKKSVAPSRPSSPSTGQHSVGPRPFLAPGAAPGRRLFSINNPLPPASLDLIFSGSEVRLLGGKPARPPVSLLISDAGPLVRSLSNPRFVCSLLVPLGLLRGVLRIGFVFFPTSVARSALLSVGFLPAQVDRCDRRMVWCLISFAFVGFHFDLRSLCFLDTPLIFCLFR